MDNSNSVENMAENVQSVTDKNNTLIIFDWDDTFFPASLYTSQEGKSASPLSSEDEKNALKELDTNATKLFEASLNHGSVQVVTNARDDWVRGSAQAFLPELAELIRFYSIPVKSARDMHKDSYPRRPRSWKLIVFYNAVKSLFSNGEFSLVVVGDGEAEAYAAAKLQKKYPNALVKTARFADKPDIDGLVREVSWAARNIAYICAEVRSEEYQLSCRTTWPQRVKKWLANLQESFDEFSVHMGRNFVRHTRAGYRALQ